MEGQNIASFQRRKITKNNQRGLINPQAHCHDKSHASLQNNEQKIEAGVTYKSAPIFIH